MTNIDNNEIINLTESSLDSLEKFSEGSLKLREICYSFDEKNTKDFISHISSYALNNTNVINDNSLSDIA